MEFEDIKFKVVEFFSPLLYPYYRTSSGLYSLEEYLYCPGCKKDIEKFSKIIIYKDSCGCQAMYHYNCKNLIKVLQNEI